MKYLIIGAGIAGVTAAETIRAREAHAEIVVIGDEQYFPYNRFLLTDYLCGKVTDEELFFAPIDFFQQRDIKFRKGEFVKSIQPEAKAVKLFHNEVVEYDKLLIATGGSPAMGPVLSKFQKFIQRYYSLQDVLVLKKRLAGVETCIVSGQRLSTLDLMCGMCNLGKKVTYITKDEKANFPQIGNQLKEGIHEFLLEKGVDIVCEDRVISVAKAGNRYRVDTFQRRELTADIVFAWDYYKPAIDIIEGTNIEKKLGILVDEYLRTSVADIYAAGDCVEVYHPGIKDYWINFGWPNAREQGEIAGKNMTGQRVEYRVHDTIIFNLLGKSLEARWWE
ncbi:MAG: NAD(P)/FAD-dependent oxidoreductase [Candidatus Zhuqueibacterota bacterium]